MNEVLTRIKRAVLAGRFELTHKATDELDLAGLEPTDIVESIVTARRIHKTLRSTSQSRPTRREYLHVIISPNFSGVLIYTKGKLSKLDGVDFYYVLVSAKTAD